MTLLFLFLAFSTTTYTVIAMLNPGAVYACERYVAVMVCWVADS